MRRWSQLAGTRLGLGLIGGLGTTGLAGWSAGMFAFPAIFRPVMPVLINGIAARMGNGSLYAAEDYELWAWLFLLSALVWGALFLHMFIRQPADDRRIDAALRNRRERAVRGAPTETAQGAPHSTLIRGSALRPSISSDSAQTSASARSGERPGPS